MGDRPTHRLDPATLEHNLITGVLTVRITRLRLQNFRGWSDLDLRPRGHVLLAGVPRAGRSDIIAALSRLLDPYSIRRHPTLTDIRQFVVPAQPNTLDTDRVNPSSVREPQEPAAADAAGDDAVSEPDSHASGGARPVYADYAEVEVTLVDLDGELEQLCDGFLEPLQADGQLADTSEAAPDARLGVRLAYRVTYDALTDTVDHVVFYPARSRPETGQYTRVPAAVRHALPVVALSVTRPLQLRAEGTLRRLVTERDQESAAAAFRELDRAITAATLSLSVEPIVATTVDAVLQGGAVGRRLGDDDVTSDRVRFQAEDGSLSALLRAVQPALQLDEAGPLALTSHGSTATAILSTAEALLLVSSVPGAIVLSDDFGDGLDAATAEHLAAVLCARSPQVWLTTRRPEAARAFAPEELVRLTRHGGARACHVLPDVNDRKEIAVRRLLHTQLLPALTAPTLVITEGPHDLTTYSSVDRRRITGGLPLSAYGVRLVTADNGSGGGTGQIPRVAALARALGFRVIALVDSDSAKDIATTLPPIQAACDATVQLPPGMAVERALLAGVAPAHLASAAAALPAYGVPNPTVDKAGHDIVESLVHPLHKHGLHEQFLEALIPYAGLPPVITAALDAVATVSDQHYTGPRHVNLLPPTPPAASASAP